MSSGQGKSKVSWIYELSKAQVIAKLKEFNETVDETVTLEALRKQLRRVIKQVGDQPSDSESEKDEIKSVVSDTGEGGVTEIEEDINVRVIKMDFQTKIDFEMGVDDWEQLVERMECYFLANDVTNENKKRAIFLTKVNAKTYGLIRKICAPQKPTEVLLVDLIAKVTNFVKPKVNITVLRSQFRRRMQDKKETVRQYLAALQELAANCEFKDAKDALKDQLLSGIYDEEIRIALFKIEDLTVELAMKTASAIEEAKAAVNKIKVESSQQVTLDGSPDEEREVSRMGVKNKKYLEERARTSTRRHQGGKPSYRASKNTKESQRPDKCACCGKLYHTADDCWHRKKKCDSCGRQGHLQTVCKRGKKYRGSTVKKIEDSSDEEETDDESDSSSSEDGRDVHTIEVRNENCNTLKIKPQFLAVKVGGHKLSMEVDGGSGISLISEKDYKTLFGNLKLSNSDLNIKYYCGEQRKPMGIIKNITFKYGEIKSTGKLYVMGDKGSPLLGRDWLLKLGLWPLGIVQSREKIKTPEEISFLRNEKKNLNEMRQEFFEKHADLFSPGLGTFNKGFFKIQLKNKTVPIYVKPRSVPFALKDKISRELDQLVDEKVLTPIEVSEWGTPIVPVLKSKEAVRLCADYKVTINPMLLIDIPYLK